MMLVNVVPTYVLPASKIIYCLMISGNMGNCCRRSYYHCPSDVPFLHATFSEMFDKSAERHPNKDVLVFYTKEGTRYSMTYSKLQGDSKDLASALLHLGCNTGDNVAMMMTNSLEFYVVQLALHRVGANICMLGKDTKQASELITKLNCVALFLDFGRQITDDERGWISKMIPRFTITMTANDYALPGVRLLSDVLNLGDRKSVV